MKLDKDVKEMIVVSLWMLSSMLIFVVLIMFIHDTISWIMIKTLLVAIGLGITARWFMEAKENK